MSSMRDDQVFDDGTENTVNRALRFCELLTEHKIRYSMDVVRDGALMVMVAVPGERWEVEFMDDGTVELERFESLGVETCADPAAVVLSRLN